MFDMTNDSNLFRTKEQLKTLGLQTKSVPAFFQDHVLYLPLYEAKMIEQCDHRFASVIHHPDRARTGEPEETTLDEHYDGSYFPEFRYWVDYEEILRAANSTQPGFVIYKDITTTRGAFGTRSGIKSGDVEDVQPPRRKHRTGGV